MNQRAVVGLFWLVFLLVIAIIFIVSIAWLPILIGLAVALLAFLAQKVPWVKERCEAFSLKLTHPLHSSRILGRDSDSLARRSIEHGLRNGYISSIEAYNSSSSEKRLQYLEFSSDIIFIHGRSSWTHHDRRVSEEIRWLKSKAMRAEIEDSMPEYYFLLEALKRVQVMDEPRFIDHMSNFLRHASPYPEVFTDAGESRAVLQSRWFAGQARLVNERSKYLQGLQLG